MQNTSQTFKNAAKRIVGKARIGRTWMREDAPAVALSLLRTVKRRASETGLHKALVSHPRGVFKRVFPTISRSYPIADSDS